MVYEVDKTLVFDLYKVNNSNETAIAMDIIVISHCDFDVVQNRILRYPL